MVAVAAKKLKNGRAAKSADALRNAAQFTKTRTAKSSATQAATTSATRMTKSSVMRAAKTSQLPGSYTDKVRRGNRTKLAEDAGKLFETIRRFAKKHKLPRSLQRRLDGCTDALWDLEMEEDAASGALDAGFGEDARRASREYKAGDTLSAEEFLELSKERRDGKVIPFAEALKTAKSRR